MTRYYDNSLYSNRNSRIVTKVNGRNTVKTQTIGRDPETLEVEVSTKNGGVGSTRLFIRDAQGEFLGLNGFEARTVYRALQNHFEETGRPIVCR